MSAPKSEATSSRSTLQPLTEASLVLRHDGCWLTELSSEFPGVAVTAWALYQAADYIAAEVQVQGALEKDHRAIREWLATCPEILELRYVYAGPTGLRFHVRYGVAGSIYPVIARHPRVALTSSVISRGLEHYTLVGETPNVRRLLAELSKAWPCRVEPLRTVAASLKALLSGSMVRDARLTERQWNALQMAYARGYYDVPRKVRLSALARRAGISASSFLYHLRQAEQKILGVVISGQVHERRRPQIPRIRTRRPPRP